MDKKTKTEAIRICKDILKLHKQLQCLKEKEIDKIKNVKNKV
jgi:hypothetical protein